MKKLVMPLVAGLFALSLTACASGTEETTVAETEAAETEAASEAAEAESEKEEEASADISGNNLKSLIEMKSGA